MKTESLLTPNPLCVLRLIASTILLLAIFTACTGDTEKPLEVLPEDKMAAILTDVHLIEGAKTGRKIMGDTLFIETYYAKVFSKHNTNLEDFNTSFEYYSRNPKIMNGIYERVVENLNKMEIRVPAWEKLEDSAAVPVDSITTQEALKALKSKVNQMMPFSNDSTKTVPAK